MATIDDLCVDHPFVLNILDMVLKPFCGQTRVLTFKATRPGLAA